jgi:hypothetical protein
MSKPPMAFAASRDDWKFRVYTLLDAAFEHALKIAVAKANGYTAHEGFWQGEMTGLERKLVYTASDEFRTGTSFNRLKAAHEVVSGIQRQRGRYWRDAKAVVAGYLGREPNEVNVPEDWDKWKVEGVRISGPRQRSRSRICWTIGRSGL